MLEGEPLYCKDELARREFFLSGGVKLTLPRWEIVDRQEAEWKRACW